jgi:TrpR-related protein YerC/YecD
MGVPENAQTEALYAALASLQSAEECRQFLADLCTIKEVVAMAQRLEIARLLDKGDSYVETVDQTGASSATVSRVNRCLNYGNGGYRMILDRLAAGEQA